MKSSNAAGSRWSHFAAVCERALRQGDSYDRLSEQDIEFAESMLDRLNDYRERTYVSVAQINWINRIETQLL